MKCGVCGTEIKIYSTGEGTCGYEPVNKKLDTSIIRHGMRAPFYCTLCGAIDFPFQAVRDVVFLYPKPAPEKLGELYVPEGDFVGGSVGEKYREPIAIVLSIGMGSRDRQNKEFIPTKGIVEVGDVVYYNKKVPWRMNMKGSDGKEHMIVYCGILDLRGIVNG